MDFQFNVSTDGLIGFTLHGMRYQVATNAMGTLDRYQHGDKVEFIGLSASLGAFLRDFILSGALASIDAEKATVELELTAIKALKSFFLETTIKGTNYFQGHPKVVSTKRGSIIVVTEYGELLGVILNHPSDVFIVNRLMSKWQAPKTWAEVGTMMYSYLSDHYKHKVALSEVNGSVATFLGCNAEQPVEVAVEVAIEGLGLTLWEISK